MAKSLFEELGGKYERQNITTVFPVWTEYIGQCFRTERGELYVVDVSF